MGNPMMTQQNAQRMQMVNDKNAPEPGGEAMHSDLMAADAKIPGYLKALPRSNQGRQEQGLLQTMQKVPIDGWPKGLLWPNQPV